MAVTFYTGDKLRFADVVKRHTTYSMSNGNLLCRMLTAAVRGPSGRV